MIVEATSACAASNVTTSGSSSASVNIFLGASLAALLLLPATLKNYC